MPSVEPSRPQQLDLYQRPTKTENLDNTTKTSQIDLDDIFSRHDLIFANFNRTTMMVDLTVLVIPVLEQLLFKQKNKNLPQGVHICMDQNLDERKKKIKD